MTSTFVPIFIATQNAHRVAMSGGVNLTEIPAWAAAVMIGLVVAFIVALIWLWRN